MASPAAHPPKQKWIPRKEFLKQIHDPANQLQYADYAPRGACREIFKRHDTELGIDGPAGTGKSRACLEKINWVCEKYPRVRALMFRKIRRSLTQSGMITFTQEVLPRPDYAPFHGGDQEYRYPNRSILAVAGMDDPQKILSSQWDIAYAQQAEELDEADWESVISRLRNNRMPYQQLIGDMNPGAPNHWMRGRAGTGRLVMLQSRHEDNPILYDITTKDWTEFGRSYIAKLDLLTGVRYKRLRLGLWAAAEGTVYEQTWDRAIHVIDRFPIPNDWPRFWTVDFGYTNPFCWQAWAQDHDGRLFRYREIYKTKTLVEDHAKTIATVTKNDPRPRYIICDHDAEDRATLERHLGMDTKAAWKAISPGIQAVEGRLRKAGDGRPRLFYMRDSLVEVDQTLAEAHLPLCTEDEYESYVWDTTNGRKRGETPVDKYNHGMDATRYQVTHIDETGKIDLSRKLFPLGGATRGDDGGGSTNSNLTRQSGWRIGGSSSLGGHWSND